MKLHELENLDLEILISLLRQLGVSSYSNGKCTISLGAAPQVVAASEPSRFEDELEKELQPCGHNIWESNEIGECLHGCSSKEEEVKE